MHQRRGFWFWLAMIFLLFGCASTGPIKPVSDQAAQSAVSSASAADKSAYVLAKQIYKSGAAPGSADVMALEKDIASVKNDLKSASAQLVAEQKQDDAAAAKANQLSATVKDQQASLKRQETLTLIMMVAAILIWHFAPDVKVLVEKAYPVSTPGLAIIPNFVFSLAGFVALCLVYLFLNFLWSALGWIWGILKHL